MNTIKRLADLGIRVHADINPDLLKQLAQLLPKEPKKQHKRKRPDNVEPMKQQEENNEDLLPPGKYIVSFSMQLRFDNSYKTKAISEVYDSNGLETKSEILQNLADKAIKETYFDGNQTYEDKEVSLKGSSSRASTNTKKSTSRRSKTKEQRCSTKSSPMMRSSTRTRASACSISSCRNANPLPITSDILATT